MLITKESSTALQLPKPKPRAVTAWIETLPLANPEGCFEVVLRTLHSFNESSLSPTRRAELAELLRDTVAHLTRQAETHFIDQPLPYPPRAAIHADFAFHLQHELGIAYALSVFDCKVGWLGISERHFFKLLCRTLQEWGNVLLRTVQRYHPLPVNYWRFLYRLYELAESHKLLTQKFEEDLPSKTGKTPLTLFKHAVLFGLANTQNLRQRQMRQVYDFFANRVDQVTITREPVIEGESAEFVMRLEADEPPLNRDPKIYCEAQNPLFLFTTELTQSLVREALFMAADMDSESASKDKLIPVDKASLLRIARNLEGAYKHRRDREAQSGKCRCIVGLPRLIGKVVQGKNTYSKALHFDTFHEQKELVMVNHAGTTRSNIQRSGQAFTSDRVPPPKKKITREDIWEVTTSETILTDGAFIEAQLVNISSKGYGLLLPSGQTAEVRIGELISVATGTEENHTLNVVRWLRYSGEENGEVLLGLELLSLMYDKAEIIDKEMTHLVYALFLPVDHIPGQKTMSEMLSAPGKTQVGGWVRTSSEADDTVYRVDRLYESTGSFERFGLAKIS